jgi:hypothetical protein
MFMNIHKSEYSWPKEVSGVPAFDPTAVRSHTIWLVKIKQVDKSRRSPPHLAATWPPPEVIEAGWISHRSAFCSQDKASRTKQYRSGWHFAERQSTWTKQIDQVGVFLGETKQVDNTELAFEFASRR